MTRRIKVGALEVIIGEKRKKNGNFWIIKKVRNKPPIERKVKTYRKR